MTRRTPEQRELDRRADEIAKAADRAPKGRKWELAFLARQARTEALAKGPIARSAKRPSQSNGASA